MSDRADGTAFKWIQPQRQYVPLTEDKSVQSHISLPSPPDQLAFRLRTKQSMHNAHDWYNDKLDLDQQFL